MSNTNVEQIEFALQKMKADSNDYFTYAGIVWDALDSAQREQLKQLLYQGPVVDGCIISKKARNDLIRFGLATRCCFLGEQGYTVATYTAYTVAKQGNAEPFRTKPGTT